MKIPAGGFLKVSTGRDVILSNAPTVGALDLRDNDFDSRLQLSGVPCHAADSTCIKQVLFSFHSREEPWSVEKTFKPRRRDMLARKCDGGREVFFATPV